MPRLLTKMRIDEISGVDKGAGEGVKVLLRKRDPETGIEKVVISDKAAKKASKNSEKKNKKKEKAWLKAERHQVEVEKSAEEIEAEKTAKLAKREAAVEEYMKREFTAEQRQEAESTGAAMKGGRYPIENKEDLMNARRAIGRTPKGKRGAVKAHIAARARELGLSDKVKKTWFGIGIRKTLGQTIKLIKSEGGEDFKTELAEMQSLNYGEGIIETVHDYCHALKHSIESIMDDDDIGDKGEAIRDSFDQFIEYMVNIAPDSDVSKAIKKIHKLDSDLEESIMAKDDDVNKAMTSVGQSDKGSPTKNKPDYVDLDNDADEPDAKGTPNSSKAGKAIAAQKALETELAKEKETKKVWKNRFDSIFKMSPEHREYLFHKNNDMDDDAKKKFVDMKDDDKDAEMKKNSIEAKIEKAMSNLPEPLRKKLEEAEAVAKEMAVMKVEKELATFTKRATDLRMPATLAESFIKLEKADPEGFSAVLKHIEALNKQVSEGKLFAEFGSADNGHVESGSAYDALWAKADELRKANEKLTREQAFAKVYTARENVDLVKQYKQENPLRVV